MTKPQQLAQGIYIIDAQDGQRAERTGVYVIKREKIAIIDTCTSKAVPHILVGLQQLHIDPADVDYVIVTHVHLDHAGGAGLLLQSLPNATFYVHPKGARHLIDPSRLIASAKSVYSDRFEQLFEPIVPIDEQRVVLAEHEAHLPFGEHDLIFYDTPGHARHHISIYDEATNSMFVGDTTGVNFPPLTRAGYHLVMPSNSPNQYDPDEMFASIALYEHMNLDRVLLGHYGKVEPPQQAYDQVKYWTPIWLDIAQQAMQQREEQREELCMQLLFQRIAEHAKQHGYTGELEQHIYNDVRVSTQGMLLYLAKQA